VYFCTCWLSSCLAVLFSRLFETVDMQEEHACSAVYNCLQSVCMYTGCTSSPVASELGSDGPSLHRPEVHSCLASSPYSRSGACLAVAFMSFGHEFTGYSV
jgi:hypothetical protein